MSENPTSDPIQFSQPTGPRPPDRRELLWNELDRLHAQLGIAPPTATYTLEALEEEVILARRAAQQPAIEGQAQFDSLPFNAPPEGGDHRSRKTWANFYAALFFSDRPTPEPYESTPSEDESEHRHPTDALCRADFDTWRHANAFPV